MEKILSISIAAYNIEKYIDKLMNSLIDSRIIDKIDIMIVSDGSSDSTETVGEKYAEYYPDSIRVIKKKNGGHGSTINKGIELAQGKYFKAIDGDDWVDTEAFVKLVEFLETVTCDMVISDYSRCVEGEEPVQVFFQGIKDGEIYTFEEISDKAEWMRYHTVTFRTEILRAHNIRLDEHCFYVDTEFVVMPIPYINTVAYCEGCVYCYRLGIEEQSISMRSRKQHIDNSLKVAETLLNYYKHLDLDLSEKKNLYILKGILSICMWHFDTMIIAFSPSTEAKKMIKDFDKLVRENNVEVYEMMEKNCKSLKILRNTNYVTYNLIAKHRQKIYKKNTK